MQIHIFIYLVSRAGNSSLVKNQCKGTLEAELREKALIVRLE